MKTQKERAVFLETKGRRCLALSSMVLFLSDEGAIKHVGVVVRRDKDEVSAEGGHLTVGVQLVDDSLGEFLRAFPPGYAGQDSQMNREQERQREERAERARQARAVGEKPRREAEEVTFNPVMHTPPIAAHMFQVRK